MTQELDQMKQKQIKRDKATNEYYTGLRKDKEEAS